MQVLKQQTRLSLLGSKPTICSHLKYILQEISRWKCSSSSSWRCCTRSSSGTGISWSSSWWCWWLSTTTTYNTLFTYLQQNWWNVMTLQYLSPTPKQFHLLFNTAVTISSTAEKDHNFASKHILQNDTRTGNMQLHTLHAKREPKTHSWCHIHDNMHSLWHSTSIRNWNSRWRPHAKLWWKSKRCLKTHVKYVHHNYSDNNL